MLRTNVAAGVDEPGALALGAPKPQAPAVHWMAHSDRLRRIGLAVWPPLLFFLCSLYLFRLSIFEGRIFFQNDTMMFYYPISAAIDFAIDQGRLPLWTPYIFAGHPLLADGEAGMFYLPNLIAYLLLPAAQAIGWLRMLRFFLGATFTFYYCRTIGLGRTPSAVAGMAFAFGSYMVGQMHHTNVGDTSIWLPLVLAGTEMAMRRWQRPMMYLVLAGVALGMSALTVHANPLALMLTLVGLYVPFRLFLCADTAILTCRDRLRQLVFVLGVPLTIGLALGAVQLLPLWELSTFSRGRGVTYEFATGFALPPANAITLLFPYFFRDAADGYWSPWFRWSTTVYVGIAPLLLAGIALLRRPNRLALFFGVTALAGLLFAFGDYSPLKLYALVYQLPVFSWLRGPERFLYWTTLSLAILAGMGAQVLLSGPARIRAVRLYLIVLTGFVPVVAATLIAGRTLVDQAPQAGKDLLKSAYLTLRGMGLELKLARDPFEGLRYSLDIGSPWTSRGLLWLVASVVLLWLCYRYRATAWLWRACLVLIVAVDVVGFASVFHPTMPVQKMLVAGPVAEFLQQRNGLHRVLTVWPAFDLWPDRLLPLRIAEASGYSSLATRRHEIFLGKATEGSRQVLDLLNVKYVVAAKGREPAWLQGKEPVFQDGAVAVYERTGRLARAFVVADAKVGTGPEVLAAVSDRSFEPERRVWLEATEGMELPTIGPATGSVGEASIINYSSDSVTVQAEADRPSFLVLGDSFYPGWTAYVDGEASTIYRADYLFRAVPIPAGRHTVRFAFEPGTVRLGAVITLAAALSVVIALVIALRRKRQDKSTPVAGP